VGQDSQAHVALAAGQEFPRQGVAPWFRLIIELHVQPATGWCTGFAAWIRLASGRVGQAHHPPRCVSEQTRKKEEQSYKDLVEEQKDATFSFKLVDADPKDPVKDHKEDGVPLRDALPLRPNLKIVKQLDLTMTDSRDNKRILGIIGFAVGEKDGKLLLVKEAPVR